MGRDSTDPGALSRPEADGLIIPTVGPWSNRKYHFLSRYLQIFSTGMKNKWPERHYVDLFAGAGKVRLRDGGEILFGSPMLAATVSDRFTKIHLCEKNPERVAALRARMSTIVDPGRLAIWEGDANSIIDKILADVPRRKALCITFADPYGLHFDFKTVSRIAQRRSDLIILMADNMDALRNWAAYYRDNPNSTLDRFMGEPGWRDIMQKASPGKQAERLRSRYFERLASLGYQHFAFERIQNTQGGDLYSLVYASRSKVGLKFWKEAASVDEGGQRSLFP